MAEEKQVLDIHIQKAESLKNDGNKFFQEGKFTKALALYDEAIETNPNVAIYWANRAFTHQKMEEYGAAITDSTKAIELDKTYAKAYYRRGTALVSLGKYKDGLSDFKKVVQIYPNNKDATEKLKECERTIKKLQFEAAIAVEEVLVSTTINLDDFAVDASYDGPRYDGEINAQFVKDLLEYQKKEKKLHTKYAYKILLEVGKILAAEQTLVEVEYDKGTMTVCGDTHGQYYDVLNIFELNGLPSETNPYLFNGDFVDRGNWSVEIVLAFFAFKILYPKHFFLTRGNHETITMNRMYGFEGEVASKYSKKMFDLFTEVFCHLPLAVVLNKKVFVCHGGLFSKDGVTLDDIKKTNRNRQPPDEGIMCELMWSDPQPHPGRLPNKRGVGVAFGPDVTQKWLKANNLELIVRSHEVKDEGYQVEAGGSLVTIFSAPNYCDTVGNKGAFIRFDASDMKPKYTQFNAVPHPNVKPMAHAANNPYSMFM